MILKTTEKLSVKQKRIITVFVILLCVLFTAAVCILVGKPLVKFVSNPEKFRLWIDSNGIFGKLAFIGMVFFQTVIAVIPGEPFEIGGGYAFGTVEGTLLTLIGILLGSILIFGLVRTVGVRMVEVFFPIEKIRSLKFIKNSKKFNLIVFIVFFIPGTPKDLLSYFMGLTNINLGYWIFVSTVARLPSIVTSAASGDALGLGKYSLAVIFLISTAVISIVGLIYYKKLSKKEKENDEKIDKHTLD